MCDSHMRFEPGWDIQALQVKMRLTHLLLLDAFCLSSTKKDDTYNISRRLEQDGK